MKRIGLISIICLGVFLSGCKTSREGMSTGKANTKALREFVASMQEQALHFHTFSARLNVDLEMSGKQVSSRVEMKLVRDSILQLSVQPFLGIEVFRLQLTPDSLKALDRMNRRYVAEEYSSLKRQIPIDFNFYNLQALFINHLFLPGERDVFDDFLYDHFRLEREGFITRLHTEDRLDIHYLFEADSEEKLLSTTITEPAGVYALQWKYSDFQSVIADADLFPRKMDVSLLKNTARQGGMTLYYSRLQLDKPLNMDFPISSKYKRVSLAEIEKLLVPNP